MLTKSCKICSQTFEITDADLAFYEKISVPAPKLCSKDRLKCRLSSRNERSLYKRKCDKTGREVISNMRPDAPCVVYDLDEWHKDDWSFIKICFCRFLMNLLRRGIKGEIS